MSHGIRGMIEAFQDTLNDVIKFCGCNFLKVRYSVGAGGETQGHAREELQEVHVVPRGQ